MLDFREPSTKHLLSTFIITSELSRCRLLDRDMLLNLVVVVFISPYKHNSV